MGGESPNADFDFANSPGWILWVHTQGPAQRDGVTTNIAMAELAQHSGYSSLDGDLLAGVSDARAE
jgi:hypothetical protein